MIYCWINYTWIAILILWIAASVWSKPTVRKQTAGSRLVHILLGVLGSLMIFEFRWNWGALDRRIIPGSHPVLWAGCTVAGILFAIWARLYLGANWSGPVTVKQDHELVRSGPYAVVRHPIYAGFLFGLLGTSIAFGRIRCFLGVIALTVAFKMKSLMEERFMQEQFGGQYVRYKHEVRALVPFIW